MPRCAELASSFLKIAIISIVIRMYPLYVLGLSVLFVENYGRRRAAGGPTSFDTGIAVLIFRKNIEHLLDHKHFELTRHDVTFPLYVEVDEIYNLACPASPIHYQRDPVETTRPAVTAPELARSCEAGEGKDSPGVDIGSLWRSECSPAA